MHRPKTLAELTEHRPHRPAESDATRRARHLDQLREMSELGMAIARDATEKAIIPQRRAANDPHPGAPDFGLTFSRATSAVRHAIALETRIAHGAFGKDHYRPPPRDARRKIIRDTLHAIAARTEPDRKARNQLCRYFDERLDDALLDDPDGDISIPDLFLALCDELDIQVDGKDLPDAIVGMKRTAEPPPGANPAVNKPTDDPPTEDNVVHGPFTRPDPADS